MASASGYRGVYDTWWGTWVVQIGYQGRRLSLGTYRDPEAAARAYDEAARKYHGPKAKLNFPGPST